MIRCLLMCLMCPYRLTQPHRIAGFAILYGFFLSFGVSHEQMQTVRKKETALIWTLPCNRKLVLVVSQMLNSMKMQALTLFLKTTLVSLRARLLDLQPPEDNCMVSLLLS